MLEVTHTIRSYSGKLGCMCGCKGTYNESERARKRALTDIIKQGATLNDFGRVDSTDGEAGCIFNETDTRNRVVYLTEAGVIAARAMGIKEEK